MHVASRASASDAYTARNITLTVVDPAAKPKACPDHSVLCPPKPSFVLPGLGAVLKQLTGREAALPAINTTLLSQLLPAQS